MRELIRASGVREPILRPIDIREVAALIGADTLDTVNLRHGDRVMLVDDAGHAKGLPINEVATHLYHSVCRPGTTHPIRGDVVVTFDSDFGGAP